MIFFLKVLFSFAINQYEFHIWIWIVQLQFLQRGKNMFSPIQKYNMVFQLYYCAVCKIDFWNMKYVSQLKVA